MSHNYIYTHILNGMYVCVYNLIKYILNIFLNNDNVINKAAKTLGNFDLFFLLDNFDNGSYLN